MADKTKPARQVKYSASRLLVFGMQKKAVTKKAFDWSRLIPWIPGVNDIRRRGAPGETVRKVTPATVAASNKKETAQRDAAYMKANPLRRAGGAQAGSASLARQ